MNALKAYVKKLFAALDKVCYVISHVWFLIPLLFFWATRGAWLNMESSPKLTDSYLGVTFLAELLFVIALIYLFRRDKISSRRFMAYRAGCAEDAKLNLLRHVSQKVLKRNKLGASKRDVLILHT